MALKSFKTNTLNGVSDINGLVHINTTSFSAVASQSVDNVFTSSYKWYKIILSSTPSTTSQLRGRLRASATSNSDNNYHSTGNRISTALTNNFDTSPGTYWNFESSQNAKIIRVINFEDIAETLNTRGFTQGVTGAGNGDTFVGGFSKNDTTAYDGIEIFPSTGTITGSISIYGFEA